jgi:hypothetical protein
MRHLFKPLHTFITTELLEVFSQLSELVENARHHSSLGSGPDALELFSHHRRDQQFQLPLVLQDAKRNKSTSDRPFAWRGRTRQTCL